MKLSIAILLLPILCFASLKYQTIENFDSGTITLYSYMNQDSQPNSWRLDTLITYNNSPYSLKLFGNTWKVENITPRQLDSNDVWQVSAYINKLGEIQGFGLSDSLHTLFYSFAGTEQLNINDWVTVYQGAFPLDTWNTYLLPISEDWLNWFGYLPTIKSIVFVNDRDTDTSAIVYFDEIINITEDLPIVPRVIIWDSVGAVYKDRQGKRSVDVQFYSQVIDSDSRNHEYFWYFGDDSTSNDSNPSHTYLIEDDHEYTVLLKVKDSTNLWGSATCQVSVDTGPTSFPIKINFIGDIMLARRYDEPGGIIDSLGVQAIFEPTLAYLGNAADITVANLESPLTNRGIRHPSKPIVFRGNPSNIAGLSYAGIDIVTLANNHIIDYGLEGMRHTQSLLDSVGILHSGAGANSYEAYLPLYKLKNGVNIGFLAYSDRTGQYDNYQPYLNAGYNKPGFANLDTFYIRRQIQDIRNIADLIVVETHSGIEYAVTPRFEQVRPAQDGDEFYSPFCLVPCTSDVSIRHQAIDAGADLVINHHPHVLQGFEVYNGKLIAHSLGDFTFDLNYPETYPTVILNTKINQNGFYEYSITPIYIDDYIPRPAKGELGRHILDYLARLSRDLDTYLITKQDSVIAKVILDTLTLNPITSNYIDTLQLQEQNNFWISKPVKLAKNGSISSVNSITPLRNWQVRLGREMVWFGNCEDEGASMWLINNVNEFYDTLAYNGSRSLCQIRPQASLPLITNFKQRIACYSDSNEYTLHGYMKTEHAENSSIYVRCHQDRTSTNALRTIGVDTVTGTTNWNFYYQDFTPANNTQFFDIWLRSMSSLINQSKTWYDDIGIIEWGNWQPFDSFSSIKHPNDYYWIQIRTNQLTNNATLSYQETDYDFHPSITENTYQPIYFKSFLAHPNPVKSFSTIQYNLLKSTRVVLKIYNSLGQEVRTIINESQTPGFKTLIWDGKDNQGRTIGAGIYFCNLKTEAYKQTRKIILLN